MTWQDLLNLEPLFHKNPCYFNRLSHRPCVRKILAEGGACGERTLIFKANYMGAPSEGNAQLLRGVGVRP